MHIIFPLYLQDVWRWSGGSSWCRSEMGWVAKVLRQNLRVLLVPLPILLDFEEQAVLCQEWNWHWCSCWTEFLNLERQRQSNAGAEPESRFFFGHLIEKNPFILFYCYLFIYLFSFLREAYWGIEKLKCFWPRSNVIFLCNEDSYRVVITNKCLCFSLLCLCTGVLNTAEL